MKLKDFDGRIWNPRLKRFGVLEGEITTEGEINGKSVLILPIYNDEAEIEIYTGFKDRNGTKIYEGDIVKIENSVGVIEFSLGIGSYVRYCDKSISLGALHPYIEKIIGNIHENPELLESLEN